MRKLVVGLALSTSSIAGGVMASPEHVVAAPQSIEQGYPNLPSGCEVLPLGSEISKSRENLLVTAGFHGIKQNGKLDKLEQRAIFGAQRFMKEIGVIDKDIKICGVLGSKTEEGVKKMLRPSDFAAESQITQPQTSSRNNAPQSTPNSKEKIYSLDDCNNYELWSVDTIKAVQKALGVAADGKFGKVSCNAMINFQEVNGVAQYGKGFLGLRTLRALGVTSPEKKVSSTAIARTFDPKKDCPKPTSCDINVDLNTQRMTIINTMGVVVWNIPVQSGKLGKETRSGSGKLGHVEYGPGRNPERKSIDYPEATLVNARGFGNGGQKFHGSYGFNANAAKNPNLGSAGCIRLSNGDSFVFAQIPSGSDVKVVGAKSGTQQRHF